MGKRIQTVKEHQLGFTFAANKYEVKGAITWEKFDLT